MIAPVRNEMQRVGWHIKGHVAGTRASRIGHACRASDDSQALLKVATAADASSFRYEYDLLRSLDVPGIVRPLELTAEGGALAMVLEDRAVVSLADLMGQGQFDTGLGLASALTLTTALAGLHAARVLHGDLRPANLLFEPATGALWIADLSAAAERGRSAGTTAPPAVEDWAWVSPEQTGRMDRAVDHRADFYALGILIYRLLTGRMPFEASDPLEWAHCHIARMPLPPIALVPQIPQVVSDLVLKLLSKAPEQRYQHALGLQADLERCLALLDSEGGVDAFPLGEEDAAQRLRRAQRLYGRERDRAALLEAFEQTQAAQRPQLVLVSGHPGIGKTSLVQELREPVVSAGGHFISAKFDPHRQDVPYAALAQGFRELVQQILAESEERVAQWRRELCEALGVNGQLVIDVVPPLALIIGPQQPVPEVAPAEAQNRMRMVFGQFVGVLARAEHPLVLFLDDLQWADVASLGLLRELLTQGRAGALLVVGAYRDNEVGAAHPLKLMLERARKDEALVSCMELHPLEPAHITALVADSLCCDSADAQALARLVCDKTEGNPFFVIQFLTELHDERLIRFDAAQQTWIWDIAQIRAKDLADNVVHLVVRKLQRLPQRTQQALQRAACLGTSGQITLLATAMACSRAEVAGELAVAERAGLVACHDDGYKFLHDRVQEAAYVLIPSVRRTAAHLEIGRLLLSSLSAAELGERVFEVVNQLNRGAELVTDPAEAAQLCGLNLAAGRKAKAALAFASARDHLQRAAALWPQNAWDSHEEMFGLHFELAECEFLLGNFQAADELLDDLLTRARSNGERAQVYGLRIKLHVVPGQFGAAAAAALDALRLFGMNFPDVADPALVENERREIELNLRGRSIDELLDAPLMTDAEARTVLGLMVDSFSAIYIARPTVFPLLVLKATNLTLRHGNCDEGCVVYTYYARVLLAEFEELAAAFDYSQLSLRLNEKFNDRKRRGMLLFSHAGFIHFWRRHFATGRPILDEAFAACLEVGNVLHAGLIAVNTCLYMTESGERLDELLDTAGRFTAFLKETHNAGTLKVVRTFEQFARCLKGLTHGPADFDDEHYSEAESLQVLTASRGVAAIGILHVLRQTAAFIGGRYHESLEAAARGQEALRAIYAMAVRATHCFYHALALAAVHHETPAAQQADNLRAIEHDLAQLQRWAEHCPQNYRTRHMLVAAELARLQGRELDAQRLYEEAISAARESGFAHNEALANELAASFYRARSYSRIADLYLADAYAGYARWGAAGKLRQLETLYPQLRAAAAGGGSVDTLAVIKASQALSSQIDLDRLVDTLMRIALEQAGAQSARLYVAEDERLVLRATAAVRGQTLEVQMQAEDVPRRADGEPTAILNYVRRTREQVLLADASEPSAFSRDPYLRERRPRSVLCLPLQRSSELIGVLYLEHLLSTHAFTPDRVSMLGLLAAQAAISLEVARLYAALKQENEQRRRAEEISREWQARIARLVESNIIGVRIADLNGRIIDANDAFLRIVGYTREDMAAGRLTREGLTAPEYYAADEHAIEELRRDGRYEAFEKEYVRKDGTRVPVLVGGILFHGDPPQTVAFVLDLSERRRAEAERHARMEAEAANQAKSSFLANMSHELRTPLNGVLGYAQLLQSDATLTARQRKGLSTIEASGRHLLELIDDILDLARIESGKLEVAAATVRLHAFVDGVADIIRVRAQQKDLRFLLDMQEPLPAAVEADERRLRQVLLNLLSNAVKFTDHGSVTLRVSGRPDGDGRVCLTFDVHDTGVGMSADELQKIFQPFQQVGKVQRRAEGTGLGLAISDSLVRQMSGHIHVQSSPGQGSSFRLELSVPLVADGLVPADDRAVTGYQGPRRRVLVVDDVQENRAVLVDLLKSLDFETAEAADGLQALEQAQLQRPDLILMDNGMDGMSGAEVTRHLRAQDGFAHVPIIAVSASASVLDQQRCLTAGANVFLAKPVDLPQLLKTIGSLLEVAWTYRAPSSSVRT